MAEQASRVSIAEEILSRELQRKRRGTIRGKAMTGTFFLRRQLSPSADTVWQDL
jgi:hypothetical protein